MSNPKPHSPRPKANRSTSPAGFTSIELLVVIAVLAVLAAIFFPALARSREKDIRVACMNNEKQLYTSLHIYCDDNGDNLPLLQGAGSWPWDMPTPITTSLLNNGCQKKNFYCPGTSPRFTDQQNWAAANSLWNYGAPNFNIVGYSFALGGASSTIASQYQNKTVLSEIHTVPPGLTVADIPATRELIPDVILSTGSSLPANSADNFIAISGGFSQNGVNYPHLSAHIGRGQVPAGGNIAYKDGHIQWRKFDASTISSTTNPTKVRTSGTTPYFWW